jgi:hypothetical protein
MTWVKGDRRARSAQSTRGCERSAGPWRRSLSRRSPLELDAVNVWERLRGAPSSRAADRCREQHLAREAMGRYRSLGAPTLHLWTLSIPGVQRGRYICDRVAIGLVLDRRRISAHPPRIPLRPSNHPSQFQAGYSRKTGHSSYTLRSWKTATTRRRTVYRSCGDAITERLTALAPRTLSRWPRDASSGRG